MLANLFRPERRHRSGRPFRDALLAEALEQRLALAAFTLNLQNWTGFQASEAELYVVGYSGVGPTVNPGAGLNLYLDASTNGTFASNFFAKTSLTPVKISDIGNKITIDQSVTIAGGQLVFFLTPAGTSAPAITVNQPGPQTAGGPVGVNPGDTTYNGSYLPPWDIVELTQITGSGANTGLTIDLSAVSQWGMPIQLNSQQADQNAQTMVGATMPATQSTNPPPFLREDLVTAFNTFTSNANGSPGQYSGGSAFTGLPFGTATIGDASYTFGIESPDNALSSGAADPGPSAPPQLANFFDETIDTFFSAATGTVAITNLPAYSNPVTEKPYALAYNGEFGSDSNGAYFEFSPQGTDVDPSKFRIYSPRSTLFNTVNPSWQVFSNPGSGAFLTPYDVTGHPIPGDTNFWNAVSQAGNQINMAINRGVVNLPDAGTATWSDQTKWYQTSQRSNLYAAFFHSATVGGLNTGVPFMLPPTPSIKLGNGFTGLGAYTFSLDENPPGTLQAQVPAKLNNIANGANVTIDVTFGPWKSAPTPSAPTVVSIDTRPPQAQPGTPTPTAPGTVTWDVLFNEPVTGVSAANFALVASAGLTGFGNIQVSPASTASAAAWTVTASTGTGSGTLGLNLTNVASIKDASGHALATGYTGQVYAVSDTPVAPTASIAIPADAQNPTSAATVTFDVTFSQAVTGLSAANFAPVAAGIAGAAVQGVSGSGTTWTVTVGTGSGSGTLGLQLANATGITPAPTGLPVGSPAYTIRQTPVAPALQSISRNLPNPTDQPQVSWTVSFSEAVAGVTAGNFSLVSTGLSGARITQVVQAPGTGTGWTVTALTGSGVGTLRLDMVNANGITDTEGLAPTGIPLQGQSYDVVRGDVPGVRIPIAFWAEPGRRANLVWPRGLVPFTGPAARELTVTLAATGGDGSFAARRDIRGITVAGTGTGPEISLTGTARNLNAYFRTAGRIGYTPSGESLLPRVLAVSAVTTTDTLAGFDTAAILVRGRTSPGRPTIAPQIGLGPTPADTPLEITYETLLAAANVPAAATRSVEFLLGRVSTGRLEIWDGAEYRVVVPRSPRFASRFEQPLLAPGGRIKWTPRIGQTGEVPAFTVRVWDGRLKSADVSQVFVDVTEG